MSYTRFAIYYLPPDGALADFGARWLGWDVRSGAMVRQLDIDGLDDVTVTPRKYGFHGTLKPPFRLADGTDQDALSSAIADLARRTAPADCSGLEVRALGSFLALTPEGDITGIARIASTCVTGIDRFRAPPTEAELARRKAAGLSPRQEALLGQWGYPYVMDEFRFHLTLTGKLKAGELDSWKTIARSHLPTLPQPFRMDQIALVGERPDGNFELIQRYALTG